MQPKARFATLATGLVLVFVLTASFIELERRRIPREEREAIESLVKDGFSNEQARRVITPRNVSVLHEMLRDVEYQAHWAHVTYLLGVFGKQRSSVEHLYNFLTREENWDICRDTGEVVYAKTRALAFIGHVGGPSASRILRNAVTEEGARRLTRRWLDSVVPSTESRKRRQEVISRVRKAAAYGLAYSRNAENGRLLEQLYNEMARGRSQGGRLSELTSGFAAALVQRDILRTMTFDEYLDLGQDSQIRLIAEIHKQKYAPPDARPREAEP